MGDFHNQWYSDIIVYDERKKYFYTWARKNKPHLDDEIKNESIANVDMIRRAVQHSFGNVGTSESTYSSNKIGATNAFKVKVATTYGQTRNFLVQGGAVDQSTTGNVEHPAVLFARGFYIFLRGDIEYINQNNLGNYLANNYTETEIPELTDPNAGTQRVDIVYVDLHFAEASAVTDSEYTDTNLKNPIVGTETASRARAVVDIRVWEDWRFKNLDGSTRSATVKIDENIFDSNDFLGAIDDAILSDPNPVNHHYRIPIAVLLRRGSQDISDNDIIDLLELYDKRIYTQQEITHRFKHGGYTQRDVTEAQLNSSESGYSGLFTARWPNAATNEEAYANSPNEGLSSEALNTNAVTPRVLDTYGRYAMESLLVGGATGVLTGPVDSYTGPVDLSPGELVANEISAKSVYVGYDQGLSGNREYTDRLNVHMHGITGAAGIAIINDTGTTGAVSFRITGAEHFTHVDYQGRHGIDTDKPGWTGPEDVWNTDRYSGDDEVKIVHDNAESARIKKHLFVDKDGYVAGHMYGKTWVMPSTIDRDNPVLMGFTGLPQTGITGSAASFQVVPGIAVVGTTGSLRGYTGTFGFYEAYDSEYTRVFTIGSKGDAYDRQVLSLYGTSPKDCFISDIDFLSLPQFTNTPINSGDTGIYDILLDNGQHITGAVAIPDQGYTGLYAIADHINYQGGMCVTGITYTYYKAQEWTETGAPDTITKTDGVRKGAEVNYEGEADSKYLKLVVKSMPENSMTVDDVSVWISRTGFVSRQAVDFIETGYYGSGYYGGDILNLNFVKLDLGEAADAWMFNGDVFFNGNGLLNRVTFSPNVVFRDDVFVYGKLSAQELLLSIASITDLNVTRNASVSDYLTVLDGFALGYQSSTMEGYNVLDSMLSVSDLEKYNLKGTVNGGMRLSNILFSAGTEDNGSDFGLSWTLHSTGQTIDIQAFINGTYNDSDWPFGIHLVDRRSGISDSNKFSTFVIDGHNYNGDPPTRHNMKLWLKGDLELGTLESGNLLGGSALIRRLTLGTAVTSMDEDYVFSLKDGNAYINNLTVSSLRYDVESTTGEASFYEPQNIKTVSPDGGEVSGDKSNGIIRVKQFSLDVTAEHSGSKVDFANDNKNKLGTETDYTSFKNKDGLWALDTLTFSRSVIEKFCENRTEKAITSDQDFNVREIKKDLNRRDIEKWEYFRNFFSRIILLKLGTLKMVWKGYNLKAYNGGTTAGGVITPTQAAVTTYEFQSTLFKSTENSNVFNLLNNPVNIPMVYLLGSFNDSIFDSNILYNMDGSLGLYIPLNKWTAYEKEITIDTETFYERYLYFRYNNRVTDYHSKSIAQQTTLNDWGNNTRKDVGEWEMAIYPKIYQQKMYGSAQQGTFTSSEERFYETIWDLNVIIYPKSIGYCNNLVGEIKMSYM